jgi:hypothetical protein
LHLVYTSDGFIRVDADGGDVMLDWLFVGRTAMTSLVAERCAR